VQAEEQLYNKYILATPVKTVKIPYKNNIVYSTRLSVNVFFYHLLPQTGSPVGEINLSKPYKIYLNKFCLMYSRNRIQIIVVVFSRENNDYINSLHQ
jgi:hypothetical protein